LRDLSAEIESLLKSSTYSLLILGQFGLPQGWMIALLQARLHYNKGTLIELMKIALPMVVSQGTFAVMIFTDRYFMSQIDPIHMAAALGGGVAAFFSFCFFSGVLSYSNAMAAQYLVAS